MRCLAPLTVKAREEDPDENFRVVPCGKCPACLMRRAESWAFRLKMEAKQSPAKFLTMTYSDEFVPISPNGLQTLRKEDYQKFFKRLRKQNNGKLRYYLCGEYGGRTQRPHYHCILFGLDGRLGNNPLRLENVWKVGRIHIGDVGLASIRYVSGYILKAGLDSSVEGDDRLAEFSSMSKNIGLSYLTERMIEYHVENMLNVVVRPGGHLMSLPRYYSDRIFSKRDKQFMADEYRRIMELDLDEMFASPEKEIEWRKDQYRKREIKLKLERQKL